jgi:uncharacterized membrane protein
MSIKINPPPLQIPGSLVGDKELWGFFNALIRTIYQMWTELFSLRYKEKTTTTDAVVTPLQRIAVGTDKSVYIEARVIARRTGGSSGANGDTAFYVLQGCFKNIGGTVSLVASTILNGGEDQVSWDCGFAVSGTQAVVVGTGAANNNITWESTVSVYEAGV